MLADVDQQRQPELTELCPREPHLEFLGVREQEHSLKGKLEEER